MQNLEGAWDLGYMKISRTSVALIFYSLTLSELTGDSSIPGVWTWSCTKVSPGALSQISLIAIALKSVEKDSSSSWAKSRSSCSHSIYTR